MTNVSKSVSDPAAAAAAVTAMSEEDFTLTVSANVET